MVGDEGSAVGVALKAVKTWLDDRDGKRRAPHCVDRLERCITDYFGIADRFGILPHLYQDWDKSRFAGLCRSVCDVARSTGDPMCKFLLEDAGR